MADEPSVNQHAHGNYIAQASESGTATVQVYSSVGQQDQNRVRFLARLRYQYQELWEQSLQGAALMTLGLVSKPNAVQHQASLLFRPLQQPERLLPPDTSIMQVYEEAGQELLILGEPGAGKSTLLLDLARQLVDRVEQDTQEPMPVLLPLSTWAVKRQPFSDWLVEQISLLYVIPSQLSLRWVQADQILPLLDGLDEMPRETRLACIAAITTYQHDHLVPLVVCSRRAEYEELTQQQRLMLHSAVVVQPLTSQQIDAYLLQAGEPLVALRAALQTNTVLQELTTTPLMLSVLSLTYTGASVQELPSRGNIEEQQRAIFARYIEHMIERKRHISFSSQQATLWLNWLAQQMQQRNQTVFYLEQLQPDWLLPGLYRHFYEWLAVRLSGVVIGVLVSLIALGFLGSNETVAEVIWAGLLGGLVGGLVNGTEGVSFQPGGIASIWKHKWHHLLCVGLSVGLLLGTSIGLVFALAPRKLDVNLVGRFHIGIIFGLSTGLSSLLLSIMIGVGKISFSQKTPGVETNSRWRFHLVFAEHIRLGMLVGALFGLSIGLSVGLTTGLNNGLSFGLYYGMYFGIVGLLLSLLLLKRKKTIEPAEIVVWSLKRLVSSFATKSHVNYTLRIFILVGVLVGLSVGLSYGLSFGLTKALSYGLSFGLTAGLPAGLSYWIFFGFWSSFSRDILDNNLRSLPNEGMRRSGRNSLLVGFIAGGLGGLLNALESIIGSTLENGLSSKLSNGVNVGMNYGLTEALSYGLLVGLVVGLLAALLTGGLAWLQHYLLRILLWRAKAIPLRYVRFLDEAVGCILLRKVGGGYSFIHGLFLDYFASLDTRVPAAKIPPQIQSMDSHSHQGKNS